MFKVSLTIVSLCALYLVIFLVLIISPQEGEADFSRKADLNEGLNVWRSQNCAACHSIYGLGGHMGPDLTNVMSRRGADYVRYIVVNGGELMPEFKISKDHLDKLVSYLGHLDSSGTYPPKSWPVSGYGEFK